MHYNVIIVIIFLISIFFFYYSIITFFLNYNMDLCNKSLFNPL